MKRYLAFVAAAALAGAAAAQSVTLYGVIDQAIAKNVGSGLRAVQNGSGNRLGVLGQEDLGDGMKAFFNIEHRFAGDTGAPRDPNRFWNDRSIVGVEGRFGRFWLGRDYTPASWNVQIVADPMLNSTMMSMIAASTGGFIGTVYNDNSINYQIAAAGFTLTAQIAEANDGKLNLNAERPKSFSATYRTGPLFVGYGYDNPGGVNDIWHMVTGIYEWNGVTFRGGLGAGKTNTLEKRRSLLLGATIPVGSGLVHVSHGRLRNDSADLTLMQKSGIAYYHLLSKRTSVYVDLVHDSKAAPRKTGYEVGLKHRF